MLDHLEAMNGKKSYQDHFFLQNPSFSSHSLLSNMVYAPKMSILRPLLVFISHFKCKAMFGLHTNFHFSFFSFLIFISHSFIIKFTFAFKLILFLTLRSLFYKFQISPFSLGFISGFNQFPILAYNILSNAHIFISLFTI